MSKYTKCDKLYIKVLKSKEPLRCAICGKDQENLRFPLSVFHILKKSTFPRLRYIRLNTLLVCFAPYYFSKNCHNKYEDNRPDEIKKIIAKAKGYKNYDDLITELKVINKLQPKTDLKLTELLLKNELEALQNRCEA